MQVDNGTTSECSAMYNLTSNTFVPYHVAELPICGGHTLLPEGRALIVGGKRFGRNSAFSKFAERQLGTLVFDKSHQCALS